MPPDMTAGKSRSVRLDAETDARVLRILTHMRTADPYRDTNDADVLRVLIRRGAEAYEAEHRLPGPGAAPAAHDAPHAAPPPRVKRGAKRADKP